MAAFDTVIRHGIVATASESFKADVAIKDGRIVAIGEALTDADEVVDAEGLLLLPGGIDSHVHIAQPSGPGIVMADDFESATRAAAFGGNTFVLQPVRAGTYPVAPGEVWLLSGHDPRSFDSRYFGPVPAGNVQGLARPVWVLP